MGSMRTVITAMMMAFLLLMTPTSRAAAATDVGQGWHAQLSKDGLSMFYWATYDYATESRLKRTLATGTEVAAPLPSLPYGESSADLAHTPDERFIVYSTFNDLNLSPYDNNEQSDVYIFDAMTSSNDLVSRTNSGGIGYGGIFGSGSDKPSLSDDGRFVVFKSPFTNLVPGDTNGIYDDIYVRDRCIANGIGVPSCTASTQLVGVGVTGNQSSSSTDLQNFGGSQSISGDGRFVVFVGPSDLDASHACGAGSCRGVFLRDRCLENGVPVPLCTPSTKLVSLGAGGTYPNSGSVVDPVISGDGSRIAYETTATNITADTDPPGSISYDVFLYDRSTETTIRLSTPPATGEDVLGGAGGLSISHDGRRVLWQLSPNYQLHTITLWADCAQLGATCGDGAMEPGCEECDDGNVLNEDGCDSNCTFPRCGNGVTTSGEECDDGNLADDDGCDSNCTVTACGNDIRTTGEVCDDDNVSNGDGCSATCTPEPGELTPSGKGKADCEFEFLPRPQPIKVKGIPAAVMICHDDDPSCDLGGEPGDKLCVFRLAFCVNVPDPRLTKCTPIDIAGATVSKPKVQDFESPTYDFITDFNRGSVDFNLAQLGAGFTGRCTAPPMNIGADCLEDPDCDDAEGDGACSKPIFEFNPPLTATNQCSDYADFVVALKEPKPGVFKQGSTSIKLKAFASNDPVTLKPRNSDGDGIKLLCLP